MVIKSKGFIEIIIAFVFISLFSGLLIENCCAEEQRAEISIVGEPTYTLTSRVIKNNRVLGRTFLVGVTIHNAGNIKSEELVVNLSDEEGFSLANYTYLDPGETKTISFTWSTMINRDQRITISYFPANLDTPWNKYNSGSKTLTIKIGDEDGLSATSTPGFEFMLVIMAVIVFTILWKKKDKTNSL